MSQNLLAWSVQPPHNEWYVNNISKSRHCKVNIHFKTNSLKVPVYLVWGRSNWTQWKPLSGGYAITYLDNILGGGSRTHNVNNPLLSVSIFKRLNKFIKIITSTGNTKRQNWKLQASKDQYYHLMFCMIPLFHNRLKFQMTRNWMKQILFLKKIRRLAKKVSSNFWKKKMISYLEKR